MVNPSEFKELYPMLGMFHFAKVALKCAVRYLTGCGIEDALVEAEMFGIRTLQTVLQHGTHYMRSLQCMLIIEETLRKLQWQNFWENYHSDDYHEIFKNTRELKAALIEKNFEKRQRHKLKLT